MLPSIEEIRKMRKNLGISQKELASETGVSQSYIARLEKGSINPTYDKIRKIHEFLNRNGMRAETIDIRVDKIMSEGVVSCSPTDSVVHALDLMRNGGFSQLPVVSADERLAGTIAEADINDLLIRGASIDSLRSMIVKRVMGPVLPLVDRSSSMSMLYPMLKYCSAVLISGGGKLVGIVTKADVLKAVETYG